MLKVWATINVLAFQQLLHRSKVYQTCVNYVTVYSSKQDGTSLILFGTSSFSISFLFDSTEFWMWNVFSLIIVESSLAASIFSWIPDISSLGVPVHYLFFIILKLRYFLITYQYFGMEQWNLGMSWAKSLNKLWVPVVLRRTFVLMDGSWLFAGPKIYIQ